jgi:hypothetical protein
MSKVDKYANDCLLIAQGITPKDKGNLAFNAERIIYTPNGFRIMYDGYQAPYWVHQQFGTKFFSGNKGFIFPTTQIAIGAFIAGAVGGQKNNLNSTRESLERLRPDNPARQTLLLNSLRHTMKTR